MDGSVTCLVGDGRDVEQCALMFMMRLFLPTASRRIAFFWLRCGYISEGEPPTVSFPLGANLLWIDYSSVCPGGGRWRSVELAFTGRRCFVEREYSTEK